MSSFSEEFNISVGSMSQWFIPMIQVQVLSMFSLQPHSFYLSYRCYGFVFFSLLGICTWKRSHHCKSILRTVIYWTLDISDQKGLQITEWKHSYIENWQRIINEVLLQWFTQMWSAGIFVHIPETKESELYML